MLDLSIIDSGQRALRVDRGNMAVILKQLVGAFQYRAKTRNIRIEAAISGLDDVWFDRDVLEKVVANLLSNATKYALDRSIVVLEARKEDGHAVLSVTNSIKKSKAMDLNRLFQRFYQEDEAAPGVGVGLALVKERVKLAQGRVEVTQKGDHS
jgi:signal transduction histidine kinase